MVLGLHLATAGPRGTYGVLEFAARTAPTVGEAIRRLVRYQRLANDLVAITLDRRSGVAVFGHRIPDDPVCVGRHGNEFTLAAVLRLCRELSAEPVTP